MSTAHSTPPSLPSSLPSTLPDGSARPSALGWLGAAAFAALIGASAAGAVATLHARADDTAGPPAPPPLPVATSEAVIEGGYEVARSYAGRVEPARETAAGFERSGLVTDIMVEEGQSVTAGTVLGRLDRAPLMIEERRLEAERSATAADLALAKATTERRERLKDRGFETGQSYDEARFQVAALEARLETIDAQLARVALDLEKSTLAAPFAGTVAERMVDEGAVVEAGRAVIRLQETARPQARIGLPPEEAAALAPGDAVEISVDGHPVAARVASVSPDLEPGTRTVSVLVDLDADAPLIMGQIARLTLSRRIDAPGIWVPLTALQEAERGLWSVHIVERHDGGAVVAREAVEVLHVADERAFVRGSFRDGAEIVLEGPHRLTLGQPVAPLGRDG